MDRQLITLLYIVIYSDINRQSQLYHSIRDYVECNYREILLRYPSYRLPLPYTPSAFDLSKYSDHECREYMRFTKVEIHAILPYLRLDLVPWRNRYKPTPEVAFCYLLWRLSYPARYKDLSRIFGYSRSWQSSVYNDILMYLVRRYYNMLQWDESRITPARIRYYAQHIEAKCGISRIWAFVDGTIRPISRPSSINQRPWYTGYKKIHGFKFQAVSGPDGLIISLIGPFLASDGDWGMWYGSGIEDFLRTAFADVLDDEIIYIYGDPAYTGGYGVMGAFVKRPHQPLPADQAEFNKTMSKVRISIEQLFGLNIRLWASNGFKYSLKIGHSPVAAPYLVGVLLTNIQACLRGNQVSEYFQCEPPLLEEYLGGVLAKD